MALAQYSLSNLSNSVSEYLAAGLLAADYLLYWRPIDALQTRDGVYGDFYARQSDVLADNQVAARYAQSRGVLTLSNDDAADPAVLVRPTIDGSIISHEQVPIPSLVVAVEHLPNGEALELGSRLRERFADLQVIGYARTYQEQMFLVDKLRTHFDETLFIPIYDHDSGTVDPLQWLEIQEPIVQSRIIPLQAEVRLYEIALTARLRYEA